MNSNQSKYRKELNRELRKTDKLPSVPDLDGILSTSSSSADFYAYSVETRRKLILDEIREKKIFRIPVEFQNDRNVFAEALRVNGMLLEFASSQLKADKELVLLAIQNFHLSIMFVHEHLKMDSDVARALVESHGKNADLSVIRSFRYLSETIRSDKQMMLSFLEYNPLYFEYIPTSLKSDKAFCSLVSQQTQKKQQKENNCSA